MVFNLQRICSYCTNKLPLFKKVAVIKVKCLDITYDRKVCSECEQAFLEFSKAVTKDEKETPEESDNEL